MPPAKKPLEVKTGPRKPILAAAGSQRSGALPPSSQRGVPLSQRSSKGDKKPKETAAKVKKAALAHRKGGAPLTTAAIQGVFKTLDTDNSGTISIEELRASVAESSELPTSLEEIKEAIEEIDVNGDGEISLQRSSCTL